VFIRVNLFAATIRFVRVDSSHQQSAPTSSNYHSFIEIFTQVHVRSQRAQGAARLANFDRCGVLWKRTNWCWKRISEVYKNARYKCTKTHDKKLYENAQTKM